MGAFCLLALALLSLSSISRAVSRGEAHASLTTHVNATGCVGAGLGAYFLTRVSDLVLDAVMSFGVAALLYLVTEELLTEAHEVDETPLLTAMFFVGFIGLLMIEMLV